MHGWNFPLLLRTTVVDESNTQLYRIYRCSQGANPPFKPLEYLVVLCFERQYPKYCSPKIKKIGPNKNFELVRHWLNCYWLFVVRQTLHFVLNFHQTSSSTIRLVLRGIALGSEVAHRERPDPVWQRVLQLDNDISKRCRHSQTLRCGARHLRRC